MTSGALIDISPDGWKATQKNLPGELDSHRSVWYTSPMIRNRQIAEQNFWDDLSESQKHCVRNAMRIYDITILDVRDWIHSDVLVWRRTKKGWALDECSTGEMIR